MSTRSPVQSQAKPTFTPVQTGILQRQCASCGQHTFAGGECEECKKKKSLLQQRVANQMETSEVPPIVHEVLRSPGQPLDTDTRDFMESRFGQDFSHVRVHTGAKAAESARAVNSLAYTVNKDIVFGKGQYSPQTSQGRQLLAHELVHTIQKRKSWTPMLSTNSISISQPDEVGEIEADVIARAITAGQFKDRPFSTQPYSGNPMIQRAIMIRRVTEDGTSREARRTIDRARQALNNPNLTPEDRRTLEARIQEAENALQAYRQTIDSSSQIMNPTLATTTTGGMNVVAAVAGLILLMGAWILGTSASRSATNRQAAESLADALQRLADALSRPIQAVPAEVLPGGPQSIPEDVPAPRPPGEVIPIERHHRYQPRFRTPQQSEPSSPRQLGPDIFPIPEPEPEPRTPRRRDDCRRLHPSALNCEQNFMDREEVVINFLMSQGYNFTDIGECRGVGSFRENTIDYCLGAPGERWHCDSKGGVVSVFGCLCCHDDGTTGYMWQGPHWSTNLSRR
jgi:hypothetical protein